MAKVYAKLDKNNVIVEINSNIFLTDITGYTLIDEGEGDRFAHAQNNYLPNGTVDGKGRYNYKFVNENDIVALTDGEKETLFPAQPIEPTFEETQMDINIDTDYRLSCLELGI